MTDERLFTEDNNELDNLNYSIESLKSLNISNITYYFGTKDFYYNQINHNNVQDLLPNSIIKLIEDFNHVDYICSKLANDYIYKDIINLYNTYN